jgi:hypothetical protein
MTQFDSLAKQIAATNTVHGSAVALIQGIASALAAGLSSQATDGGAQLRALSGSLTQQAQVLAGAISANTPAGVVIPVAPPNPPNTPLTPTSYGYDPATPMLPVTPVHGSTAPEPYGKPVGAPYGTPNAPNESPNTDYDRTARTNKDDPYATTTRDPGRVPQYAANLPPNAPNQRDASSPDGRTRDGRNADGTPNSEVSQNEYDTRDPDNARKFGSERAGAAGQANPNATPGPAYPTTDANNQSVREAREAQEARDRRNATMGQPNAAHPNEYGDARESGVGQYAPNGTPLPNTAPPGGAPTATLGERQTAASAGPPFRG